MVAGIDRRRKTTLAQRSGRSTVSIALGNPGQGAADGGKAAVTGGRIVETAVYRAERSAVYGAHPVRLPVTQPISYPRARDCPLPATIEPLNCGGHCFGAVMLSPRLKASERIISKNWKSGVYASAIKAAAARAVRRGATSTATQIRLFVASPVTGWGGVITKRKM